MALNNTQLISYIQEDIEKYQGIMVPVKATLLERTKTRSVNPYKLHPNPDDEFCDPSIGPNYGIISDYVEMIARYQSLKPNVWDASVIVQKIRPDGYMILNGHHRWAAALKTDFKKVPISIVNLTMVSDVENMIKEAQSDKRVSMDMDEVIFCTEGSEDVEKPLPFPWKGFVKGPVRNGIPALFHNLTQKGYDIWLYSSRYYSYDMIWKYFEKYSVKIAGIITGTGRKSKNNGKDRKQTRKLLEAHYRMTLHIDTDTILLTRAKSKEFKEYKIDKEPASEWPRSVYQIIEGINE